MKKFFAMLIFLIIINIVFSQQIYFNSNDQDTNFLMSENLKKAENDIQFLRDRIRNVRELGFKTTRFNDELFLIRQIFENNLNKEKENEYVNYQNINEKINSLNELIDLAYTTNDELKVLNKFIKNAEKELDTSQAREIYLLGEKEFFDERYEKVLSYVDKAYEKVNELQSLNARAAAVYAATQKNIINFIYANWQFLLILISTPIIIYLIFRKKIKCFIIKTKINSNKFEITVLKGELKKAQEQYFVKGNLAEGEYTIKMKLYGEKIRDINRKIALLNKKNAELKCKRNV